MEYTLIAHITLLRKYIYIYTVIRYMDEYDIHIHIQWSPMYYERQNASENAENKPLTITHAQAYSS